MNTVSKYAKTAGVILLVVGITIALSGVLNVYGFPGSGPDIPALDFTITASRTLIRIQPGMSGALTIWVNLFCPNSTSTIRCDSTILQHVTLQILGGCPGGAYCVLDRTQLLVPPLYGAGSDFFVYTFTPADVSTQSKMNLYSVSTITIGGIDQFGQTHVVQFGVVLCYC